jgi:hypothetical protein
VCVICFQSTNEVELLHHGSEHAIR